MPLRGSAGPGMTRGPAYARRSVRESIGWTLGRVAVYTYALANVIAGTDVLTMSRRIDWTQHRDAGRCGWARRLVCRYRGHGTILLDEIEADVLTASCHRCGRVFLSLVDDEWSRA
jgi:hypothetical protein